jgi:hypothetical protein
MNKEEAAEAMATFVYENISNRSRDGSKESYVETCAELYDFMKEHGIIA